MFGYGAAIAGTSLLDQAGTLAPSFLVGSLLGPRTLGFYAVGSRLPLTVVELVSGILGSVSVPSSPGSRATVRGSRRPTSGRSWRGRR